MADELAQEDVSDFDISQPKSDIQKDQKWQDATPTQRRDSSVDIFWRFIGVCLEHDVDHCTARNVKTIAKVMASGDPECLFYCGEEELKKNAEKIDGDNYILGLAVKLGQLTDTSDTTQKRGKFLSKKSKHLRARAIPILALVIIKIGIQIGSMAAVGYFSRRPGVTTEGKLAALAPPAKAALAAGGGCFDVNNDIFIKRKDGTKLAKKLGEIQIGDEVESLDENTGKVVFSKVYFIANDDPGMIRELLRIYYQDDDGSLKDMGLSQRHLIYVSQGNSSKAEPIMASHVKAGEFIWVRKEENLKPYQVRAILPYLGQVAHPLTENHHIIVNNVHASVHITNEDMYRKITTPLQWACKMSPAFAKSQFLQNIVKVFNYVKEPFVKPKSELASSTLLGMFGLSS